MVTVDLRAKTPEQFAATIAAKLAALGVKTASGAGDLAIDAAIRVPRIALSPVTPARSWGWRSARTGGCLPPPAATGRRGYGTRSPASTSAPSPATPVRSRGWRSARTGGCLPPPAATGRRGYGTRSPASTSAPSLATSATGFTGWRSARTGGCSPPPAKTGRCGCGTRSPASTSAPSPPTAARSGGWRSARTGGCSPPRLRDTGPVGCRRRATARQAGLPQHGLGGGVQFGRAVARYRRRPLQRRRDGVTVGPGHRRAPAHPHRPRRRRLGGGVQPGRAAACHRQRRRHGAAMGPGHRRAPAHLRRPHRHGLGGGVQPGRAAARHRQRRQDGASCGTDLASVGVENRALPRHRRPARRRAAPRRSRCRETMSGKLCRLTRLASPFTLQSGAMAAARLPCHPGA